MESSISSAATSCISIDIHHPLYLHPSDIQGLTLVPQILTGSDNYTIWNRAMRLALKGKNKLGFIDGTYTRASEPKFPNQWDRCNAVVLSWLLNSVDKEIANGIVFSEDAHSVWKDLQERYHKQDGTKIFSLYKSISSLTQGTLSVANYYTQLKKLWDEHGILVPIPNCQCTTALEYAKLLNQQRLFQFLMGLNEVHQQARSHILLLDPLPSVNRAYSMICQDEEQRSISSQTTTDSFEPTAAATTRGGRSGRGRGRGRSQDECSHCHRKGHRREQCYELIGYPPRTKGGRQLNSSNQTTNASQNTSIAAVPSLTQQQYNDILQLLRKDTEEVAVTAAGHIEEEVSGDFSWDIPADW